VRYGFLGHTGGIALIEQAALTKLYHEVKEKFGHTYYPQPILAELLDGLLRPALCFVAEDFSEGNPDPFYIDEMIQCAREIKASRCLFVTHHLIF